jgi:nicotinate-nucleotide adenylyltransferase
VRIAVFGGTFDPIHRGHFEIARQVMRRFRLDRILFVIAAKPPHKPAMALTDARDRYAMVALALRREKRFVPSNIELTSRARKNYTIHTLQKVRRQLRASDELFFILGADQFAEWKTWYRSDELLHWAALIVISRPGLSLKKLLQTAGEEICSLVRVATSKIGRAHV